MELSNSPIQQTNSVQNKKQFRNVSITFQCRQTPIDYFKLPPRLIDLKDNFTTVSEEAIIFEGGEYLQVEKHLSSIDHTKKETIVFNIPVGKGKTSACYDLIEKYVNEGFYVIVCSPFTKLVDKDFSSLKNRLTENKVYNYQNIEKAPFINDAVLQEAVNPPVQVMTINCLLQNPGEKFQDQSFAKRAYLKKLKQHIAASNKKVVFFFDEIHESIHNFYHEYIPNLVSWKDITHKCYVSSATFTCASISVIRHISKMTDFNVKVYYSDRLQNAVKARLHLHFTEKVYHSSYLSPLNYMAALIDRYKANRKINILVGHKNLVKAMTDKKSDDTLIKKILELSPNVVIGGNKNKEFNHQGHNIGTTFKTGMNLEDPNSVLFIVTPALLSEDIANTYGIFTDGIPSIIQSIARVRNGGDVHIFMYAPDTIIDLERHKDSLSELITENANDSSYLSVNDLYPKLVEIYNYKKARTKDEQEYLNIVAFEAPELEYNYPSFDEYLIEKSQEHIVNKYPSMGKYLSPYVLWASINNQFCNSELATITYHTRHYNKVVLNSNNAFEELPKILSQEKIDQLADLPFPVAFQKMPKLLDTIDRKVRNGEGQEEVITYVNEFYYNNKLYDIPTLKTLQSFNTALVKDLYVFKTGEIRDIEKEEYIRTCIANALTYNNRNSAELPELVKLYRRFNDLKVQFVQFVEANLVIQDDQRLINNDFGTELPDTYTDQVIRLVHELKESDKVLNDTFSFFHNHKKKFKIGVINSDIKIDVSRELVRCFINRTDSRRTYNGDKNYYIVIVPIENTGTVQEVNFIA